jgi:hypothetical protein
MQSEADILAEIERVQRELAVTSSIAQVEQELALTSMIVQCEQEVTSARNQIFLFVTHCQTCLPSYSHH